MAKLKNLREATKALAIPDDMAANVVGMAGPFRVDELERIRPGDRKAPGWDLRVMRTLLTLHCRCDRLEEDIVRLSRPWWRRIFR